jgi:hypothetical protein
VPFGRAREHGQRGRARPLAAAIAVVGARAAGALAARPGGERSCVERRVPLGRWPRSRNRPRRGPGQARRCRNRPRARDSAQAASAPAQTAPRTRSDDGTGSCAAASIARLPSPGRLQPLLRHQATARPARCRVGTAQGVQKCATRFRATLPFVEKEQRGSAGTRPVPARAGGLDSDATKIALLRR